MTLLSIQHLTLLTTCQKHFTKDNYLIKLCISKLKNQTKSSNKDTPSCNLWLYLIFYYFNRYKTMQLRFSFLRKTNSNQLPSFLTDRGGLYLIPEKSIWKNQVQWTGFLVYFKRNFYCLCSLQKSISKLIFAG